MKIEYNAKHYFNFKPTKKKQEKDGNVQKIHPKTWNWFDYCSLAGWTFRSERKFISKCSQFSWSMFINAILISVEKEPVPKFMVIKLFSICVWRIHCGSEYFAKYWTDAIKLATEWKINRKYLWLKCGVWVYVFMLVHWWAYQINAQVILLIVFFLSVHFYFDGLNTFFPSSQKQAFFEAIQSNVFTTFGR